MIAADDLIAGGDGLHQADSRFGSFDCPLRFRLVRGSHSDAAATSGIRVLSIPTAMASRVAPKDDARATEQDATERAGNSVGTTART